MKFKLDENFGTRTQRIFRERGYEVETVQEENLGGAQDQYLYEVCAKEQRCLVTLDLDFTDVLRFPPIQSAGIVVIRLSQKNPTLPLLERLINHFLNQLEKTPLKNELWIVEPGRIRVHQTEKGE